METSVSFMPVVVYFFKKPPFSREPTRRKILHRKTGAKIVWECRVPNTPITTTGKTPLKDERAANTQTRLPAEGDVGNSGYTPADIRISLGSFHEA
jgi:hypothetical protein